VAAAFAAGVLLALAGTLMQRMTGNPMASPEMLGVSSGAALGGILVLVIVPGFNPWVLLAAAIAGALIALLAIVALSWRSAFAPDRMLLTGVALSTLLNAFAALFMVSGDSRVLLMLSWMTGSTYRIDAGQALVVSALAVLFLLVTPLCNRWLAIMPLGAERTRALGISLGGSRLVLLLLTAVMTAAATLAVGPLSFVGLIAPHIARMLGARRPIAQLLLSAMLGGTLLVLADWLGRNLVFPWQIPAGIFATFIGGPYFMWLLVRKR
jgi:iron complex transport system permease protein